MFGRTLVEVQEYQRGLLYEKGRFIKLLEPGQYTLWPWQYRRVECIDLRETSQTVEGSTR